MLNWLYPVDYVIGLCSFHHIFMNVPIELTYSITSFWLLNWSCSLIVPFLLPSLIMLLSSCIPEYAHLSFPIDHIYYRMSSAYLVIFVKMSWYGHFYHTLLNHAHFIIHFDHTHLLVCSFHHIHLIIHRTYSLILPIWLCIISHRHMPVHFTCRYFSYSTWHYPYSLWGEWGRGWGLGAY